ncbi:hypothetical protein H101_08181, partial [Trichophyton interdigitale H6]
KGYDNSENTYEPTKNLKNAPEAIKAYQD